MPITNHILFAGSKIINNIKRTLTHIDYRYFINGHDFTNLLQIYLNIKQKDAKETFEKLLYGMLDFNDLTKENLFSSLQNYSFTYRSFIYLFIFYQ